MTDPADTGLRGSGRDPVSSRKAKNPECRRLVGRADLNGADRASANFPAELASAGRARDLVRMLCRRWQIPGVLSDAEIVVTELVENAVRHSRSECSVTVQVSSDTLTISVSDHASQPPRLQHPRPNQAGGRGLLLIEAVSRRWGFQPTENGKLVWADLPLP